MYKDGASFQGTMTKLPEQKQKQNIDLFIYLFYLLKW